MSSIEAGRRIRVRGLARNGWPRTPAYKISFGYWSTSGKSIRAGYGLAYAARRLPTGISEAASNARYSRAAALIGKADGAHGQHETTHYLKRGFMNDLRPVPWPWKDARQMSFEHDGIRYTAVLHDDDNVALSESTSPAPILAFGPWDTIRKFVEREFRVVQSA